MKAFKSCNIHLFKEKFKLFEDTVMLSSKIMLFHTVGLFSLGLGEK